MLVKRPSVVVLLVLVTACGQSRHGSAVLKAEPTATPTATATTDPTPVPTAAPTPDPTTPPSVAPTTPKPTVVPTHRPTPVAATHAAPPSPTASPTPADSRPAAMVVVHNRAGETVKGTVGDYAFTLTAGHDSARMRVHVDPGGNTGVEVMRADDPSCGEGGQKDLLSGHSYTYTISDGGSCAPGKTSPTGSISEG